MPFRQLRTDKLLLNYEDSLNSGSTLPGPLASQSSLLAPQLLHGVGPGTETPTLCVRDTKLREM